MLQLTTICWHTFTPSVLRPSAWVVDLGAHRGLFAESVVRRFGVRCLAVEPVPHLYQAIPASPRLVKDPRVICDRRGPATFHISRRSDASSLLPLPDSDVSDTISVEGVDLPSLLADHAIPITDLALLKVDIEGAEVAVFAALPDDFLRSIPQITVEFHDFCGLVPPGAVSDTLGRLTSLGFQALKFSRRTHENVLLLNSRALLLSPLQRGYVRALTLLVLRPWWFATTHPPLRWVPEFLRALRSLWSRPGPPRLAPSQAP